MEMKLALTLAAGLALAPMAGNAAGSFAEAQPAGQPQVYHPVGTGIFGFYAGGWSFVTMIHNLGFNTDAIKAANVYPNMSETQDKAGKWHVTYGNFGGLFNSSAPRIGYHPNGSGPVNMGPMPNGYGNYWTYD